MGLRIVVAEDNLLVREGLVRLLSTAHDVEVVASCEDCDAVAAAVEEQQHDVVLTDIRMPPRLSDEDDRPKPRDSSGRDGRSNRRCRATAQPSLAVTAALATFDTPRCDAFASLISFVSHVHSGPYFDQRADQAPLDVSAHLRTPRRTR